MDRSGIYLRRLIVICLRGEAWAIWLLWDVLQSRKKRLQTNSYILSRRHQQGNDGLSTYKAADRQKKKKKKKYHRRPGLDSKSYDRLGAHFSCEKKKKDEGS